MRRAGSARRVLAAAIVIAVLLSIGVALLLRAGCDGADGVAHDDEALDAIAPALQTATDPPRNSAIDDRASSAGPNAPPATIADREEVTGVVVDARGQPVADAWVEFAGRKWTTGRDGRFAFPLPEFDAEDQAGSVTAGRPGFAPAQALVRRSAHRALRLALLPAVIVEGVVRSRAEPLEGALVTLVERDVEISQVTKRDGVFRFEASSRRCEVQATARGFMPAVEKLEPSIATRFARLDLHPVPSSGRVRVVDEARQPVVGARVSYGRGGYAQHPVVGRTDERGLAFHVPALAHMGSLGVSAKGFPDWGGRVPEVEDGMATVVLTQGFSIAVQAAPGTPEPTAWRVALGSAHGGSPHPHPGFRTWTPWARLSSDGRVVLSHRGERTDATLLAERWGADGQRQSYRHLVWRTERLSPGTTVEWTPPGLVPLEVEVRARERDVGVPASVSIFPSTPWAHARDVATPNYLYEIAQRASESGAATFWVFPGRWGALVRLRNAEAASAEVDVGPAGAKVGLSVAWGHEVKGRVQMADGTPLPFRFVSLAVIGNWHAGVHTDDAGDFTLRAVPAGDYDIRWEGACGDFGKNGPMSFTVPSPPLTLVVTPCVLRGEIGPLPGTGYTLGLRSRKDDPAIPVGVDERGRFRVDGISAGTWTLEWSVATPRRSGTQEVVVDADTFVTVDTGR